MARRFSLHAQPLLRATDASIAKMSNVTKSHHLQLATPVGARFLLALFQTFSDGAALLTIRIFAIGFEYLATEFSKSIV
jgi:hypothetical protein